MPAPPEPPETLPKYITDGVPKQDTESLHNLQDWIDNLLAYREEILPDQIEEDPDESIEVVEDTSEGTIVIKKVTCGKENCKCQSGELHGPYKYVVSRHGDSLNWDYRGPVSH